MNDDVLIIVVVLFGVGVGAWLLLRNKGAEMPPPPCNVGVTYSGVGVAIPCNAIKDIPGEAVKMATKLPTQVLKPLAGGVANALGFGSTGTVDCSTWGGRGAKLVSQREGGGTCGGPTDGSTTTKVSVTPETTAAKRQVLTTMTGRKI